ncbi:MAG: peptidylprolyl isomerase [Caldilineaceae bacterium]|nr:peptidylprolyl isomerase [Caldilineaceae bacterium]
MTETAAELPAELPTELPTEAPTPLPTPVIITETAFAEGLATLQTNISRISGLSLDEYRQIIRARLLREKLQEVIASETVTDTEEAVHARHILLRVREPEPTPTAVPDGVTPEPTLTPTPLPDGAPTPTPTPGPRDDAATLALANELRQRLENGEDFATLAAKYSDDPGSAANGGDLGWFGRAQMVAPFADAAFSLAVDEISEPVKTDFGYHLIQVLERDAARPKDQAAIDQERSQAYQTWLQEQLADESIQRADNLVNLLPAGL